MKTLILMFAMGVLVGCANMTPGQKTAAWVVGGVIVGAAIASSGSDDPNPVPGQPHPPGTE